MNGEQTLAHFTRSATIDVQQNTHGVVMGSLFGAPLPQLDGGQAPLRAVMWWMKPARSALLHKPVKLLAADGMFHHTVSRPAAAQLGISIARPPAEFLGQRAACSTDETFSPDAACARQMTRQCSVDRRGRPCSVSIASFTSSAYDGVPRLIHIADEGDELCLEIVADVHHRLRQHARFSGVFMTRRAALHVQHNHICARSDLLAHDARCDQRGTGHAAGDMRRA